MKNFIFALQGAAVTILLFAVSLAFFYKTGTPALKGQNKNSATKASSAFDLKIEKVAANFFGSLSAGSNLAIASPKASSLQARDAAAGMGGGGTLNSSVPAGTSESGSAKIMPPYESRNYKFFYKGEGLKLENAKMDILKRVKGINANIDAAGIANSLNFSGIDMGTFPGLKIQNISFIGQGDFSYSISAALDEGMISIYQNWETWPAGKCGDDQKCYEAQRVAESDIPSNEELIKIAGNFLAEHNIDVKNYSEPQVQDSWRQSYADTKVKSDFYFPDAVEVVYPLKIQNKFVFDEYNGIKQGLSVSVQVKARKAASIYNLTTQQYDSSSYEMETDASKILAYAEKGGSNYYFDSGAEKTEELELGEPEAGYIKYYSYKDGKNEELLVPALSFPIKNPPQTDFFFRKAVVVPIAKEILDERSKGNPDGMPVPLMKDAGTVSSPDQAVTSGSGGGKMPSAISRPNSGAEIEVSEPARQ
jgi:hypothetical protein